MIKLLFTQPEFASQFCELPDDAFTVGRSRRNQIILDEDSVSAEHCELLVSGREVIVRERGSRNGIFVDGVRVQAQSGVKHKQIIRFGRVEVRLELEQVPYAQSTVLTALDVYRQCFAEAAAPAPEPAKLPVTFTPRQSSQKP